MATKEIVTKVWIEEGCIVCDACETAAPDVFEVLEDTCIVRPEALTPDFTKPRTEAITDAAEECPVDVIKFETVAEDVPDEVPTATAETVTSGTEVAKAPSDESGGIKKPAVADTEQAAAKIPAGKTTEKADGKAAFAVATAVDTDPAIQALLKAATARGGNVGIMRRSQSMPESVQAWTKKDPKELPPDARQARVYEAARKTSRNPQMDRREVLSKAALTVGWVAFGGGVGISIGPAFARFMMPNVLEEPDPRVRVGKIQRYLEMDPGGVNEDYKTQGIWMIREETRIAALSTICTHLGCIPNWLPSDRKFKCPCHGSGYKPNGINFEGPTPRPLERFRINIEDGLVVVDKSKKYQYELGQWDQPGASLEV